MFSLSTRPVLCAAATQHKRQRAALLASITPAAAWMLLGPTVCRSRNARRRRNFALASRYVYRDGLRKPLFRRGNSLVGSGAINSFCAISLKKQLFARPNLPHQSSAKVRTITLPSATPPLAPHSGVLSPLPQNAATAPNASREACIRPKHASRARPRAIVVFAAGDATLYLPLTTRQSAA